MTDNLLFCFQICFLFKTVVTLSPRYMLKIELVRYDEKEKNILDNYFFGYI